MSLFLPFTTFPRREHCSVCGSEVVLVRHHCHTEDLVRTVIRSHMPSPGHYGLFARTVHWRSMPAVRDLARFPPSRICRPCNSIDSADPASRRSIWLSLSADEMKLVRQVAGGHRNTGPHFQRAIRSVREVAWADYGPRVITAVALGRQLVVDFLAQPERRGAADRRSLLTARPVVL